MTYKRLPKGKDEDKKIYAEMDKLPFSYKIRNKTKAEVTNAQSYYMLETGYVTEMYENHGQRWYKLEPWGIWFQEHELEKG